MSAVGDILRFVFAFIDSILVWIIKQIYGLFYQLTDIMLYSEDIVQGLGQRIGLILGIFMLFRLAVSLVTYLISPDKLNDSAKGGGKLLTNVIISLVLLATVNIIFIQAYKIQDVIIRSKFIEKIFFGSQAEVSNTDISYYLYTPLFSPNEEAFNNTCADLWDPTIKIEDDATCDNKLYEILGDDRRAIYRAFNFQDMSIVFRNYHVVTAKSNGVYAFDYMYFAPIAGAACALVLISFSMDLALRAIKLLFLQIIAPIPIISNIDPGKGQDMFKKWYQECIKTYITVFIRVLIIDFAVFLITLLLTKFDSLFISNPLLNIALIVGALIFAKQVPNLIEDMFGIKMDGMALNPLKKFQEQALFGKNITGFADGISKGVAAGAVGGVAGFIGGVGASRHLNQKPFQVAGAGAGGFFRGFAGGLSGGYKSKNMLEALGKGKGQSTVQGGRIISLDGTTRKGRRSAAISQFFGTPTDSESTKKQLDLLGNVDSGVKSLFSRASSEKYKHDYLPLLKETKDANGNVTGYEYTGETMADFKVKQERLNTLRNQQFDYMDYANSHGGDSDQNREDFQKLVDAHNKEVAELDSAIKIQEKEFDKSYITLVSSHELKKDGEVVIDNVLENNIHSLVNDSDKLRDEYQTDVGLDYFQDDDGNISVFGGVVKDAGGRAEANKGEIEISDEYKEQQASAAFVSKKGNN